MVNRRRGSAFPTVHLPCLVRAAPLLPPLVWLPLPGNCQRGPSHRSRGSSHGCAFLFVHNFFTLLTTLSHPRHPRVLLDCAATLIHGNSPALLIIAPETRPAHCDDSPFVSSALCLGSGVPTRASPTLLTFFFLPPFAPPACLALPPLPPTHRRAILQTEKSSIAATKPLR